MSPERLLDLPLGQGQVASAFRFDVVNGSTGANRGTVSPVRESNPTLEHDATATISRRVSNLTLGVEDAARFNPLTDRIDITMIMGDADRTEYPLGRYMPADATEAVYSQGSLIPLTLYDEMFVVDQDMEIGFNSLGEPVDLAIARLLDGLPIGDVYLDSTLYTATNSWSAGTSRGSVLNELATLGGYFKPWFDHHGRLRVMRAFEPGDQAPDIDLDDPPRVYAGSISRVSDLLTAPNRFVVVSNNIGGAFSDEGVETAAPAAVTGTYDVPSSAPHSLVQRGFVLPKTLEAQVTSISQASTYARTLGVQRTNFERVELDTPPDPRHDSYNVIRWDGQLWLEIGWSMNLTPGSAMRHTLRRAYPTTGEDVETDVWT